MARQILVSILLLLLIPSCINKNKKDVYVFKSTLKNDSINLFFDEKEIGQIPYIDTIQVTNLTSNAILISLGKGKHELIAKDKSGASLSSLVIDISGYSIKVGPWNYSKNKTNISILKNDNKYSFRNRSSNEFFIYSLD